MYASAWCGAHEVACNPHNPFGAQNTGILSAGGTVEATHLPPNHNDFAQKSELWAPTLSEALAPTDQPIALDYRYCTGFSTSIQFSICCARRREM